MTSDEKQQVAGAVPILQHFVENDAVHERNAAKRVFAEVVRAWPGDVSRLWWKWFSEAAFSLGRRTKTLDCTLQDATDLAGNGARLICYREHPEGGAEWLAVVASSKGRFQVLISREYTTSKRLSLRSLKKTLEDYAHEGTIRCVVMAPVSESDAAPPPKGNGETISPFSRLWQLLRPEASDIWLVVVFAFVVAILMLATPIAVEALVNTVAFGRFVQPIVVLALILLTFLGFQGAVRALQTYVVEIVQRRLFARVAGDLAYRLPRADLAHCDGKYVPELVNRFFDVVTVQKVAAQLMLDGLGLVLNALIGMAVLGFYHPWLLGFDMFLLVSIAVIIFVLGRGAVASAIKESKHKYYMAGWLEDVARCPVAFRNDGGAEFAIERADKLIHDYLLARRKHFRIVLRQVVFALGLQAVASTVLLGLGGWLVVSGELTLGQLVAAELIVTVIVGSFAKFGKHMESFYDLLASVDKLGVLFDLPTQRQDGMLDLEASRPTAVILDNVSYSPGGGYPVLSGVSAQILPGDHVAVEGPAGSGKSTLLDILYGLREASAGTVTIDGFDPVDLRPDVLRDRVALARGSEVFAATIEENVHMHREEVRAADIREILDGVGLLPRANRLPEGCNTELSSDGSPLSETDQRLLSIARAVAGSPGLLLIDGVIDGLGDADLERVLNYLQAPDKTWTLVVATSREDIAQRLDRRIELHSTSEAAT